MIAAGERFVILDPSLTDFRGHHFMMTDVASRSAEAADCEVIWLASTKMTRELARRDIQIEPWFRADMYDAYKGLHAPTDGLIKRTIRILMNKTSATPKQDGAATLASDLQRAIEQFSGGGQTRFLAHTADGNFFRALAVVAPALVEHDAFFHVCTPYDPAGVIPNKAPEGSIATAIETLKSAGRIGQNVFMHAENPFLAKHLGDLWGVEVSTLEIPSAGGGDKESAAAAAIAFRERIGVDDKAIVVGSLGPARIEKGFHLFPEIIRNTINLIQSENYSGTAAESLHFALHAAPQIIGRDPLIQKAINEIECESAKRTSLFKEPLSNEEYQTLLGACDIILMPYDADKYRVRGSGVVIEALASGKIIVATTGSYPAGRIDDGAGRAAETPIEFAHAVCEIASDVSSYSKKAMSAAKNYRRQNHIDDYIKKLLRAEPDPK